MSPDINLINVSKSFGETVLFDNLNFLVPAGSITCLLGPSGCGKTTMLNMMAGLVLPDFGIIESPGRHSFVFQESRLLPWHSVKDNAAYAMDPHLQSREKFEQAESMLDRLELTGAADLLPGEVSGGMARRTALARALLASHDTLFLDEPLSSLDPDMRARIVEFLPGMLKGKTVVLVTHDYVTAAALSDRVFRMTLPPVAIRPVDIEDLEGTLDQIERVDKKRSNPD
jgi:ABC-type nitrate/sulfonate/bicarbonate transport system ATPase subunit